MHFSIPETVECTSKDGTCYVGYHIRVNGLHHCTLRYKQLRHLHQQLQRVYGSESLPEFPPKKFLPLTPVQAEERRLHLEKYLQIVAQDPRIKNGVLFPAFLHLAQSETHLPQQDPEVFELQVSLPGEETIVIKLSATDQTDTAINLVSQQIRLKEDFLGYFGLFVYEINEHNEYLLTRKLLNYESPCLTLRLSGDQARLVFRKTYWDPSDDEQLVKDPVGLKLVYNQMLDDIKRNWILPDSKQREMLKRLMNEHRKEECVRLGRAIRFYGGVTISDCQLDYPCADTTGAMHINSKELTFIGRGQCEMVFRVTRIRSWRMTTLLDTKSSGETKQPPKLELSFEYLLSKDRLHWITVTSEQLILLSLCLQSLVEELVRKQAGESGSSSSSSLLVNDEITSELTYMKQDGAFQPLTSIHRADYKSRKSTSGRAQDRDSMLVRFRNGKSNGRTDAFVENSAFNNIRDEDL